MPEGKEASNAIQPTAHRAGFWDAAIAINLFWRLVGFVSLSAHLSLHTQVMGLFGEGGILPLARRIKALSPSEFPSLFVLLGDASNFTIHTVLFVGEGASLALSLGLLPALSALVAYLAYFSFVSIGWPFLSFQWDALLCETLLLSGLAAPFRFWVPLTRPSPTSAVVRFAIVFLCVRLHVASGLVKILSRDPSWANLTALDYHFETQPLPNPISPIVHFLPSWVHKVMTLGVFALEIVLPFLSFFRPLRPWVGAGIFLLQGLINLTGNYGFFNLLSAITALPLLDDQQLQRLFPRVFLRFASPQPLSSRSLSSFFAIFLVLSGGIDFLGTVGIRMPSPLAEAKAWTHRLHLTSPYGPFAVMTTIRYEIGIEVSQDGKEWKRLDFRYKPDSEDAPLPFLPLHMPRLDWQMWFAALGEPEDSPWLFILNRRLLEGSESAASLFENPPQPSGFRLIRAVRERYRFDPRGKRVWVVEDMTPFGPTLGYPMPHHPP
ncbi:MAG: lipase maturation factor family protein [Sandaracinaceae bacterium]|nr:lipase maturation factor family protein [Sandaracinaceae bacterium]